MPRERFREIPNRAACSTLVGYGYQVDLTILRWLKLSGSETLELECGEDIDTLVGAPSDCPDDIIRRLEQVKALKHRVTLKSPSGVVAFLANCVYHDHLNPDLSLRFLFTTNAQIGKERPGRLPSEISGLQAWSLLREGELSTNEAAEFLAGIRSTLESQPRPEHVSDDVWNNYTGFVDHSTDDALRNFILRTEWGTAQTEPSKLPEEIQRSLLKLDYCRDMEHAEYMYNCMFVHVFRTLAAPPPRRLRFDEIEQFAELPAISEADRFLLDLVGSARVQQLGQRMDFIEARVSDLETLRRGLPIGDSHIAIEGAPRTQLEDWASPPPPRIAFAVERDATVRSIQQDLDGSRWLNLHGGTGTGKTQLLWEVCHHLNSAAWWVSLRDTDQHEAETVIRGLAKALPASVERTAKRFSVVLDDLPVLNPTEGFAIALTNLASSVCTTGFLLTSSYHVLPNRVLERIRPDLLRDVEAPPFNVAEFYELLRRHGAPEDFIRGLAGDQLVTATRGHPMLLVAIARLLKQRGWRLEGDGLPGLFAELQVGEFTDQLGARILDELEEDETRELLYRLALINGEFETTQVAAVSENVHPPIVRADEKLIRVLGLWIERRPSSRLSVSPLLLPLAKRLLPDERQIAVYAALASDLLSRPLQSVFDALNAIDYSLKADLGEQAVIVLTKAIDQSIKVDAASLRLFLSIAEGPAVASLDLTAPLVAYLLGQRFRAREYLGEQVLSLVDEVLAFLSSVEDADAWVIPMLALNSLPAIAIARFGSATQLVERALQHLDDVRRQLPDEDQLDPSELGATLLWGLTTGVRLPADLRMWMELLAGCTDEVRETALAFPHVEMGLSGMMDSVVHNVGDGPTAWEELEQVLVRVQTLAEELGLGVLSGCAARSQFILRSEVANDAPRGLAEATSLLEETTMVPEAEYALRDAVARHLLDSGELEQGTASLTKATQLPTEAFPFLRWSAFIRLAASMYELHGTVEFQALEAALAIARKHPTACAPFSGVRALGELGIAAWVNGEFSEAFAHLEEALADLIRCQVDNPEWKATFVLLGHALGYIAANVTLQASSQTLTDGQPYPPPRIGHFLNNREELAGLYRSDRLPGVHYLVSMLANGVGNRASAEAWAIEALEQARDFGVLEVISTSAREVLVSLLAGDRVAEAIDVALEGALALIVRQSLDLHDHPPLEPVRDLPRKIAALPPHTRAVAELQGIADGALLSFLRAARVYLTDAESALGMVNKIIDACEVIRATASNKEAWSMAVRTLHMALVEQSRAEDLLDLGRVADQRGYTCLTAMAYFGYGLTPNAKLKETAVAQTLAAHYVFDRTTQDPALFTLSVLEFLEAFWSKAIDEQRFRFRTPALAKSKFDEAMQSNEATRAQAILDVALTYLGARLPDGASEEREWLKGK